MVEEEADLLWRHLEGTSPDRLGSLRHNCVRRARGEYPPQGGLRRDANTSEAMKLCRLVGKRRHCAVVAAIASVGLGACGGPCGGDSDSGSSDGVEETPRHRTELANYSFERPTLMPWQIGGKQHATFAVTRRSSWEGQRSARIRARGTRVRNS